MANLRNRVTISRPTISKSEAFANCWLQVFLISHLLQLVQVLQLTTKPVLHHLFIKPFQQLHLSI